MTTYLTSLPLLERLADEKSPVNFWAEQRLAWERLTTMPYQTPVCVLYQAQAPPPVDGIHKPMKPGGYADSGADIAFALRRAGIPVVTPATRPNADQPFDWVFPDTQQGIQQAFDRGARLLWLNTVLFGGHPADIFLEQGGWVVGQDPQAVELYDDKWRTNQLLRTHGLPIPKAVILNQDNARQLLPSLHTEFSFPLIIKPIRGRGSAGVSLVETGQQLASALDQMLSGLEFGDAVMVEEYLPGQEVTLTVMPPGSYQFNGQEQSRSEHWCLPPVKRFNHHNGVAPYNGTVAVLKNSLVLTDNEIASPAIDLLMNQCAQAAKLVDAKAPIRIDCRQSVAGVYYLFDLNMKPNMTGAGRPGRDDQDSLSALAAREIGWNYTDLLLNMLRQAWHR